ncbi:PEP-CTERM-box response regulator transcription factor [Desulfococcus sp.]|uniref:PEP-CTERM-box response regulator transcription factor n=1 Tax=Desulfococcus sp. TaxID=2025834 RepID=UPI00359440C9
MTRISDMDTKIKLLIVEDDEDLRTQMKWALSGEYDVLLAGDRAAALEQVNREHPLVMTLDLGLPPDPAGVSEGFTTLQEVTALQPTPKVVIVTGRGEKEHALNAVSRGAYDFFLKPIEIDELKIVLRRAAYIANLEAEHRRLQERFGGVAFEGMLGTCDKMQEVYKTIRKVAATDAPVLIEGESGTGKELVARAIHSKSPRQARPFVVINCGAIPENLLESELFGHEKGAFSGAHAQRKGRFEMAEGGTLFLDEIGEMPLSLQVKLLRFLQEKVIERVGGREEICVDARIIAATNRTLKEEILSGAFRDDLYFRLNVVKIAMPPLRDREDDIILLAKAFLKRFAEEYNIRLSGFTSSALKAIRRCDWSGNVRELENRIKRAVIMAEGKQVTPADLDMEDAEFACSRIGLKEARAALEERMIKDALKRNNGNITNAAAELGVSRPTLYEMMGKFGILNGSKAANGR